MEINYTLPSGKAVVITIAQTNWRNSSIGAQVTAMVAGCCATQYGLDTPAGLPAWAVSAVGRVPLDAATDAAVRAAVEAIKATDSSAAQAHVAALDAIDADTKRIERAMAC